MSWRHVWRVVWSAQYVCLLLACVVAVILASLVWVLAPLREASALPNPPWPQHTPEPPDLQETLVVAPTTLLSGAQGAARAVVYDPRSGQPIPGVRVRAFFAPRDRPEPAPRYEGETDALGTASIPLDVPVSVEGEWDLVIETIGPVGEQRVVRPVIVRRQAQLELATDRTVYRPGQTIHAWLRALEGVEARPLVGRAATLEVYDARGRRICSERATTSAYGVAQCDCPLARRPMSVPPAGRRESPETYRVVAALAALPDAVAERTVRVDPTAPARFDLAIEIDGTTYVPGQPVRAVIRATQPWGAPLAHARVQIASVLYRSTPRQVGQIQGRTDEQGVYAFAVDRDLLPERLLQDGPHPLRLAATVTDANGHTQQISARLSVAGQALIVQAQAESGALLPGLDNLVHVRTTYPDGRPAACMLTLDAPGPGSPLHVETDDEGLAQVSYRPSAKDETVPVTIVARDAQGRQAHARVMLPVEAGEQHLLVRPDRANYRPGETVHVDAWLTAPDAGARAVYLDLSLQGPGAPAFVAAYAAPVTKEHAALAVDLPADVAGTLALHGYAILADGSVVSGSRQVIVGPEPGLVVAVHADREQYAPGDSAQISVDVADASGQGRQSALSVALLSDDSATQAAGAFLPAGAGTVGVLSGDLSSPRPHAGAVQAARAGVVSKPRPTPEHVLRQFDAVSAARAARGRAFTAPAGRFAWALVAVAGLLGVAALAAAWRASALRRPGAPGRTARALGASLLGGLLLLPLAAGGAALLAYGGRALLGPGMAIALAVAWLGVLLALLVYAWERRNAWALVLWAATLGCLILAAGMGYARAQGATLRVEWIVATLAALGGAALALYLFGAGLARREERGGATAAWMASLALLVTLFALLLAGAPRLPPRQVARADDQGVDPGGVQDPHGVPVVIGGQDVRFYDPRLPAGAPLSARESASFSQEGSLETAYWQPEALTDAQGRFTVRVPLVPRPAGEAGQGAWRVAVRAFGERGAQGAAQVDLEVSQPLWIEAQLPDALTVGDELDLPLAVYNALPVSQTVYVTVTQDSWFSLRARGSDAQQIEVPAHEVGLISVPIRVREWGEQRLEAVATSERAGDTFSQQVDVAPAGHRTWRVFDGQIEAWQPASAPDPDSLPAAPPGEAEATEPEEAAPPEERWLFRVPWSAIRGTERVTVTLYPHREGVLAEGLRAAQVPAASAPLGERIATLREIVLAHSYLGEDESWTAAPGAGTHGAGVTRALAESYQQLLAFERAEGGFGEGEAPNLHDTANALAGLADLAGLYPVDPALIERTAQWLLQERTGQGTWQAQEIPPTWRDMPRVELPTMALVTWSLIEAGFHDAPELKPAIEHLERYLDKAADPYVLALAANALLAYGDAYHDTQPDLPPSPALDVALARLAEMAEQEDGTAAWHTEVETVTGATGAAADVECTALALYALLRGERDPLLVERGLLWLAGERDVYGRWGSAEATFHALRAWLAAVQSKSPHVAAKASVTVDEVTAPPLSLRSKDPGAARPLVFDELARGYNDIVLSAEGLGTVPYRVVGTYVLPWEQVSLPGPEEEILSVEVGYDRTTVAVGETISATVAVMLNRPGVVPLAVLELGLPPGLELVEDEWQDLVRAGVISRYERAGGHVVVHLAGLSADSPVQYTYRLRAEFPLAVQTGPTYAYPAADPQQRAVREPVWIEVVQQEGP